MNLRPPACKAGALPAELSARRSAALGHLVLETLAGLELGCASPGDVDFGAGAWVAALAGFALGDTEGSEADEGYLVAVLQAVRDGIREGIEEALCSGLGGIGPGLGILALGGIPGLGALINIGGTGFSVLSSFSFNSLIISAIVRIPCAIFLFFSSTTSTFFNNGSIFVSSSSISFAASLNRLDSSLMLSVKFFIESKILSEEIDLCFSAFFFSSSSPFCTFFIV